jgi:hypothetical protein
VGLRHLHWSLRGLAAPSLVAAWACGTFIGHCMGLQRMCWSLLGLAARTLVAAWACGACAGRCVGLRHVRWSLRGLRHVRWSLRQGEQAVPAYHHPRPPPHPTSSSHLTVARRRSDRLAVASCYMWDHGPLPTAPAAAAATPATAAAPPPAPDRAVEAGDADVDIADAEGEGETGGGGEGDEEEAALGGADTRAGAVGPALVLYHTTPQQLESAERQRAGGERIARIAARRAGRG